MVATPDNLRAYTSIAAAAKAIEDLAYVGAVAYANGGAGRQEGIVAKHFTAGNEQRYGWRPLSEAYQKRKEDMSAAFKASGKLAGRKVPAGVLPMLVALGVLKSAVASRGHQIVREGDRAVIIFGGLPTYALYHHTGAGHNSKRSPVEPGTADLEEMYAVMSKYLSAQLGQATTVGVSGIDIPGQARATPV